MHNYSKKKIQIFVLNFFTKAFLCAILFINFLGLANAQVDSVPKKRNNFTIGLNLAKEVSYSVIYSPRNNTLLGLSFGMNNIKFKASANYVNRAVFEKQNYIIGGRDRRRFPLAGIELALIYVSHLYNNKIIHPMFGLTYKKSIVYGGWSEQIFIDNTRISFNRMVNFNDKFYQIGGLAGFYFSMKNKFGFTIYFPIGVNRQSSENSHYLEQMVTIGSSPVYETKKEGYKNGFVIGINSGIFYNFNL
jgi:hypothetical protein